MSSNVFLVDNWANLTSPSSIEVEYYGENKARIIAGPLERGFGVTLGNSFKRILLSFIQGTAINMIKIDGVPHEFSVITGMKEDMVDFILNLKQVVFKVVNPSVKKITAYLDVAGGVVTAGMIDCGQDLEVINKDHIICTMSAGVSLKVELTVAIDNGYVPAARKRDFGLSFFGSDAIPVDAIHSPVKKVAFEVLSNRIGQVTDYDKLVLSVETNGAIAPDAAVSLAARILQEQCKAFVCFIKESIDENIQHSSITVDSDFDNKFLSKVEELELSVRSFNCLKAANIKYLGDLVQKTEAQMLKMSNFGKKSLNEIKSALVARGMNFGMDIPSWPPTNLDDISSKD